MAAVALGLAGAGALAEVEQEPAALVRHAALRADVHADERRGPDPVHVVFVADVQELGLRWHGHHPPVRSILSAAAAYRARRRCLFSVPTRKWKALHWSSTGVRRVDPCSATPC